MTNATVLADALVEAGILKDVPLNSGIVEYKLRTGESSWLITGQAERTITDWRVAGKVLESAHMAFIEKHGRWQVRYDKAYGDRTREWHSDESLPRAIIEAWYEARQ